MFNKDRLVEPLSKSITNGWTTGEDNYQWSDHGEGPLLMVRPLGQTIVDHCRPLSKSGQTTVRPWQGPLEEVRPVVLGPP